MNGFKRIVVIMEEFGLLNGLAHVLSRVIVKLFCYINAILLGWNGAHVPVFSRIINPRCMRVGNNFYAASSVWIEAVVRYKNQRYAPLIEIGNNFSCSDGLHISSVNQITIGDNCLFGSNVYVGDHNHGSYSGPTQSNPLEPPSLRILHSGGEIRVGCNCWVGNNAIILAPSMIGDGVVIAANSVVKGNYPPNSIVAGAPARIIKHYNEDERKWISI